MFVNGLKKVQEWILPHYCCFCEEEAKNTRDVCSDCEKTLPWAFERCYRCGLAGEFKSSTVYCENCVENPPGFDRLCAVFSYEKPITKLIRGLKFGRKLCYGQILGEWLADKVNDWYPEGNFPEAIIPIPLHPKRLSKRGYNQALECLWSVKKQHKIPILHNVCSRIRHTKPQSELKNRDQRRFNLNKAFRVIKPLNLEHVAIMDDVVTTGSTVNNMSMALKAAGVLLVDVWCMARD